MADSGYNDLGEFDYTYDSASNVLSAFQAAMGELEADRAYGYDTLNRLVTAQVTDTQDWVKAAKATTWYSYDDVGNRISHQYRDASAIGYEHDKANRMTTYADKDQGYDLAGNQTRTYSVDRGRTYRYLYDHHNRLTQVDHFYQDLVWVRSAAYAYDALGRRNEFINDVSGETLDYYYDGVNEIVERDKSGNRSRYYVHGISYVGRTIDDV